VGWVMGMSRVDGRPRTLYQLQMTEGSGRAIQDFSLFPQEHEVLLPPNMCFRVESSWDAGHGLTMVQCKQTDTLDPLLSFCDSEQTNTPGPSLPNIGAFDLSDLKKLEVIQTDEPERRFGRSPIWHCELKGRPVAAKFLEVLYRGAWLNEEKENITERELVVMWQVTHPNILSLVGTYDSDSLFVVCTEFCQNGSLFDCLHVQKRQFTDAVTLQLALGAARGLCALHKHGIVHSYVTSRAFLIAQDLTAKLYDFDVAQGPELPPRDLYWDTGPPPWVVRAIRCMAPEGLKFVGDLQEPGDVYSYAMLLWELYHKKIPYSDWDHFQVNVEVSICFGSRARQDTCQLARRSYRTKYDPRSTLRPCRATSPPSPKGHGPKIQLLVPPCLRCSRPLIPAQWQQIIDNLERMVKLG